MWGYLACYLVVLGGLCGILFCLCYQAQSTCGLLYHMGGSPQSFSTWDVDVKG